MLSTKENPKTVYNLNQGQKDLAEVFYQFLFSADIEKEFIVSGPAGVGKTYWMGYIIDVVMPRYHEMCKLLGITPEYEMVVMTAVTNKAADVLSKATGYNAQTIHSFLNIIVKNDFKTGETKLSKHPKNWHVHEKLILFIDECSMIDTELYKIIQEGTHKCKIVYVGDHKQLAPVKETLSPVYKHNAPFFELTEPMRTKLPELQALNQQLRDTVGNGVFKPIQIIPGVIDHLDDNQLQTMLQQTFNQQTLDSRVLAYTNQRVIEFNDYIRYDIRKLPSTLKAGEYLVNNSPVKLGLSNQVIPAEQTVKVIFNSGSSTDMIIEKVYLDYDDILVSDDYGHEFLLKIPTNRTHYNELLKYFSSSKVKNWAAFFKLKEQYADLRPRDAATVHKSQGSTYDSVFVDLGNISTCRQPDQVARMLYVALSRARNHIYLYGELVSKYGGLILP